MEPRASSGIGVRRGTRVSKNAFRRAGRDHTTPPKGLLLLWRAQLSKLMDLYRDRSKKHNAVNFLSLCLSLFRSPSISLSISLTDADIRHFTPARAVLGGISHSRPPWTSLPGLLLLIGQNLMTVFVLVLVLVFVAVTWLNRKSWTGPQSTSKPKPKPKPTENNLSIHMHAHEHPLSVQGNTGGANSGRTPNKATVDDLLGDLWSSS